MTKEEKIAMFAPTPEQAARYAAATHAMQSGVAASASFEGEGEQSPKHLRVGVNSALVEAGALGRLLIIKGVVTKDEYYEAIIELMLEEVKSYETALSARHHRNVTLG